MPWVWVSAMKLTKNNGWLGSGSAMITITVSPHPHLSLFMSVYVCICVSVCVHTCVHVPHILLRRQIKICKSQLFPSTIWVQGIKLVIKIGSKCIYPLSRLPGLCLLFWLTQVPLLTWCLNRDEYESIKRHHCMHHSVFQILYHQLQRV